MDRYRVEGHLGEGCFGTVTAAAFTANNRQFAIKRIPVQRLQEGLPHSLVRELLALQQVCHRNVIRLHEAFPRGSSIVFVMERCETDLAAVLANQPPRTPLPEGVVKSFIQMALEGVEHLHSKSIMHRDIKPSNFLVAADGTLKLGDFGLARPYKKGVEMTHEVATRWYRAPELLFGCRHYTPAVDIWGLGCVFAELLAGSGGAALFPGEGDIDQMHRIFRLLGTPTEATWPGVKKLPDWGKIIFPDMTGIGLAHLLPHAPPSAIDLLQRMVCLNPAARITAAEALDHPYFFQAPPPAPPAKIPRYQPSEKLPTYQQLLKGQAVRAPPLESVPWSSKPFALTSRNPISFPFVAPSATTAEGRDGVEADQDATQQGIRREGAADGEGPADDAGYANRLNKLCLETNSQLGSDSSGSEGE